MVTNHPYYLNYTITPSTTTAGIVAVSIIITTIIFTNTTSITLGLYLTYLIGFLKAR
jgi:hypothetical protein